MIQYKLILTGPVDAGKTTAIKTVTEVPIIQTDAIASDMTKSRKPTTTVAMDYGILKLDQSTKIHLYGTPGQERFDFMWEILVKGGSGIILLLDNTRADPFHDMKFFLDTFSDFIKKFPVLIAITKMDIDNSLTLETYQKQLKKFKIDATLISIDARNQDHVRKMIIEFVYQLNNTLIV